MSKFRPEAWRVIDGHEDYEVSNLGRFRCRVRRRYLAPGDLLALSLQRTGYLSVHLDGHVYLAHRIVCAAFHGKPVPPRMEVAHTNGDRSDNRDINLRWATRRENAADIKAHGTENPPRGEKQGRSMLKEVQVRRICDDLRRGARVTDLSREYGVARTTISAIANGYNWRHVRIENEQV